jgi:hypothetical protein
LTSRYSISTEVLDVQLLRLSSEVLDVQLLRLSAEVLDVQLLRLSSEVLDVQLLCLSTEVLGGEFLSEAAPDGRICVACLTDAAGAEERLAGGADDVPLPTLVDGRPGDLWPRAQEGKMAPNSKL